MRSAEEIRDMLKIIPNNFPVEYEDLEEIFKNDNAPRQMAKGSNEDKG